MKPFLYLDNWHAPQPETRVDKMLEDAGLEVERLRTNEGEAPAGTDYCGVYVSPSFNGAYDDEAWIHREHDVLRDLAGAGIPMMGLCFGTQILASALCGHDQVTIRAEREKGFGRHPPDCGGAGRRSVDREPAGADAGLSLARGRGATRAPGHRRPRRQPGLREPDLALASWSRMGIQPHPELDGAQLLAWFESNREVFETGGLDYDELVSQACDQVEAGRLIENFLGYVKGALSAEGEPESAGG